MALKQIIQLEFQFMCLTLYKDQIIFEKKSNLLYYI